MSAADRPSTSVFIVGGGFAARLGVHAFFGSSRSSSIIDDPDAARIDWDDENDEPGEITP